MFIQSRYPKNTRTIFRKLEQVLNLCKARKSETKVVSKLKCWSTIGIGRQVRASSRESVRTDGSHLGTAGESNLAVATLWVRGARSAWSPLYGHESELHMRELSSNAEPSAASSSSRRLCGAAISARRPAAKVFPFSGSPMIVPSN